MNFRDMTWQDLAQCSREEQKQILETMAGEAAVNYDLQRRLVPQIDFTTVKPQPPEPLGIKLDQPEPVAAEEDRARRIFQQHPNINEVQIGSVIYFRRQR